MFALFSAQVVSESEFDDLSDRLNSVVIEARERICQALFAFSADLLDGADNEEPEQVSVPAASPKLPVRRLYYTDFFTFALQLHPKQWCPFVVWRGLRTFTKLPTGWPPLPGKRSLVRGEGEVRLSSG